MVANRPVWPHIYLKQYASGYSYWKVSVAPRWRTLSTEQRDSFLKAHKFIAKKNFEKSCTR